MKKIVLVFVLSVGYSAFGNTAYACDLHGAGYDGFGLRNAPWQPYNPQVSTTDPAFSSIVDMKSIAVPTKSKPSFSNAANRASTKAKTRLAQKKDSENPRQETKGKKAG